MAAEHEARLAISPSENCYALHSLELWRQAGMDLHKLRTFSVVAAEGNITRAARRLSTSQPAISKQLAELEDALGTPLFHRLPRGVRLTEAGQILRRHADRIFQEEGAAESELAALSGL